MTREAYATVKLPKPLAEEVDALIGKSGFSSRAEIVKKALRELLDEYKLKLPSGFIEYAFRTGEAGPIISGEKDIIEALKEWDLKGRPT